jgi:CRISPR-associated protein Csb2
MQGGGSKANAVARRLGGAALVREGTGEIVADLRGIASPLKDGVTWRYMRAARRWGSVTPLILPGRDDRQSRKAHGLVLKALAQAGCTAPVAEVHLQAEPVFPGAEMAGRYRVPAYLKAFPRTHAIITSAEPIAGPIALGSGRHVGLGVMAALD